MRPKVSVYITSHNYGRYLREAVDSVLAQNFRDWEILLIDDGSDDDTQVIMTDYVREHPEHIRQFHNDAAVGLAQCANLALKEAKGEYIMRLDADDYLDESALLLLSNYLDMNPEVALVYSNYIYVDQNGGYLGIESRKKLGTEAMVLDLPAHGACTMGRKRMLLSVGGYYEDFRAQDGHDLWMKVLHRFAVANITTPLFFYRQHSASLTRNEERVLSARQQIKRATVQRTEGAVKPRTVGIIPAKNTYEHMPNRVLELFAGKALIDYTVEAAIDSGAFDHILITTDDPKVIEHCRKYPSVLTNLRSLDLSREQVRPYEVLSDAVEHLEKDQGIFSDMLVILNVHCPLRRASDIRESIDTALIYDVDSVISVYEDYDVHFAHGQNGMEPINRGMMNRVRLERESLYVDNGAIRVVWRDMILRGEWLGTRFGHTVMPRNRSFIVSDSFDRWLVEQILLREASNLTN